MQITHLMVREHKEILAYLNKFLNNFDAASLRDFKTKVVKHFDSEEEAIFRLAEKFIGKEQQAILVLKKQHKEILPMVKKIKPMNSDKMKEIIKWVSTALRKHAQYEEKVFYPKLDTMLEEGQREEIIQKLKEII